MDESHRQKLIAEWKIRLNSIDSDTRRFAKHMIEYYQRRGVCDDPSRAEAISEKVRKVAAEFDANFPVVNPTPLKPNPKKYPDYDPDVIDDLKG